MNQQSTLNLFDPWGKVRSALQSKTASFLFGVAALLLIAVVAYVGLSGTVPSQENQATGNAAFLAANPELMIARRYTAPSTAGASAAILAANPELSIARRFQGVAGQNSDAHLAANPELIIVHRFNTATAEGNVCSLGC